MEVDVQTILKSITVSIPTSYEGSAYVKDQKLHIKLVLTEFI